MAGILEDMTAGRNRVRAALTAAKGLTSQQVGENAALSRALSLPSGIVDASPDRARQERIYRRIAQSPAFARWAEQTRENAALARDDTEGLAGVFDAVANFGNNLMHWMSFEAADDVANMGRALQHGVADVSRSVYGAGLAASELVSGENSVAADFFRSALAASERARPKPVKAATKPGQFGYDFLRSVPQQSANIAAAMTNPALVLPLMGIQIGGSSYVSLREQHVTPERAAGASALNAALQAPLERLSLGRFMSIFKSSSFRDTAFRTLGAMATEGMTEYVQKYPEVATELWGLAEKQSPDPAEQLRWFSGRLTDADTLLRAHREGLYEGAIGSVWGALGGGARFLAVRHAERQRAEEFARQNVELHAAVEASETGQTAPDYMEDALASASDILAQSVYIPAQEALDLVQRGQDVLTPLGISAEQVQKALESGADLEVSLATLQARLDADGMTAVSHIMRQSPDAPNALEAGQVDSAAQAQAVVEEARRGLARSDELRREEARLVSEMLPLVGNRRNAAEQYARLFRAQAVAFETAYGTDALESLRRVRLERGEETAQGTKTESSVLGQPVNDGVNLDAPVRIVSIAPRFEGQNPRVLRKRFPEDIRQNVLNEFTVKGVVNADTGKRIGMSKSDFHEYMKFSDTDAIGGLAQLEAVAALPDLMRNARLVESYDDKKDNPSIKKMHRFQAALRIGRKDYSVKLTVKEFRDGMLMVSEDNPFKLYHHRLEKEMPAGNSETLQSPGVNRPSASIAEYSLRALLEDVKDSEGQRFFQDETDASDTDALESLRRVRLERGDETAQGTEDALHQSVLYEQTPLGDTARASLERDARDFGTAVDRIVAEGKLPSSPVRVLGQTPLVMQLLGADTVTGKAAAAGGVYAAPHVFDGTHPNMTPEMWKQIPTALADPIAVFDSGSPAGRARGDLVFMLELTDANGATVVVPVALDSTRDREQARINILKSAYTGESDGVPSNRWFLTQLKKNARYMNGQKMKAWLRASGANSPLGSWKDLAAANASGNRVYTDSELVKLREASPTFYQSAAPGVNDGTGSVLFQDEADRRAEVRDHELTEIVNPDQLKPVKQREAAAELQTDQESPQITALPVNQGVVMNILRDRLGVNDGTGSVLFQDEADRRAEVRYPDNGQDSVAGFVLREDGNGNRFYDHELTQIIDPDSLQTDRFPEGSVVHADRANQGAVINILRDRPGVNDGTGSVLFQDEADRRTEVRYPDNGQEVGSISPEIAATLRLNKSGAIVLNDSGLQHIEDRHGKEIRGLGFTDARAFVDAVLSDVSAVYDVDGSGRKYDLVSRAMTPQGRVMVRLEFAAEGDFYTVATAGTVRRNYYEKKVPLWESANLNHSPEGTPDATFSGQSGTLRQDAATEINLTSGVAKGKRASVTFHPDGRAVIRIFRGADVSSILHEAAHIFVDDLQRVAHGKGMIAGEALAAELERADLAGGGLDADLNAIVTRAIKDARSGNSDAENLRSVLTFIREERARFTFENGENVRRQHSAARPEVNGKTAAAEAQKVTRSRLEQLRRLEPLLAAHVRHRDGLAQAQRDIATLRKFAGVAEHGELTAEQWRDVQEYAARGFEQYLAEGRAPSPELSGVFARMMRWLKKIYAGWRQYVGAELNDDVRRVFDRLLVADVELQQNASARAAFEQEQDFVADAHLTADERAELDELRIRAEAEVTARMDRVVARERGRRYREAYRKAKKTIRNAPFWTFVAELTRREKPLYEGAPRVGGIRRESLVEYLGEDMTRDITEKMPRLVNSQGGGSPLDTLEVEHNLADGDADALARMIYDVIVVQDASVHKLAARQAEQTLAEQDRQAKPEVGLLNGDAYGQYLEAVEKVMQRLVREQPSQNALATAQRTERERLPERYYRNLARQEVAAMSVSRLSPRRYSAALRRALTERSRAFRRGKLVDAVRAVQRARMAFAMMQEVTKARAVADRAQKKARKAVRVRPGAYPVAQTEAIRKLVFGLGLSAPQQAGDTELESVPLRNLVQMSMEGTAALDLMPLFPDWLLNLENPDPSARQRGIAPDWKGLRVDEVEQVENLLDFLVHSGREQGRKGRNSLRARVQAIADSAAASLSGMPACHAPRRDSLADSLARGFSSLDSLEWQCRKADGFQHVPGRAGSTGGAMEREVSAPLRAATDRYHARLASTQQAMTPHLVRLLESAKAWERKFGARSLHIRDEGGNIVPVPEAIRMAGDQGWTAEMVIGMALHLGSEGNRERLRSSYRDEHGNGGLTFDMVSLILGDDAAATLFGLDAAALVRVSAGRDRRDGILSAADWQAVQGVWDVLGRQWTDTQAAHKRLYGFAPGGMKPGAFVVRIGDEIVQMPGGCYPVTYDPRLDRDARTQEGKESILARSERLFGVPASRRDVTPGRVPHTGRSVSPGVEVLQGHLVDAARFIELGYDVCMADRIVSNPAFASEYQRVFGVEDYDSLRPGLKSLVADGVEPSGNLYKAAELVRKHLEYARSCNVPTALFPAMEDIGVLNVARGVAQLVTRGMGLVREVREASPYMRRRFRTIDDDLARKVMQFNPGRGVNIIRGGRVCTWDDVAHVGMMPIVLSDLVVITAIWSGAYNKKLKETGSTAGWSIDAQDQRHAEAAACADSVIARLFSDNDAPGTSVLGREQDMTRLFTSLSGAAARFAQRTHSVLQGVRRGRGAAFEVGREELYDMFLPAVALSVMAGLVRGTFGGEDDDTRRLAELVLSCSLGQMAMALPVAGTSAVDMLAAMIGSDRRGEPAATLDIPVRGSNAARTGEISEESGEKLLLSALDIASHVARISAGSV